MHHRSCDAFQLQHGAPLPDEHVQRGSGHSVRVVQPRHPRSELDGADDGADEDELARLPFPNEREQGADEDGVVDDLKVQLVREQLQVSTDAVCKLALALGFGSVTTSRGTDSCSNVGLGWSFAPALPTRQSRPAGRSFAASAAAFSIDAGLPTSSCRTASRSFG